MSDLLILTAPMFAAFVLGHAMGYSRANWSWAKHQKRCLGERPLSPEEQDQALRDFDAK